MGRTEVLVLVLVPPPVPPVEEELTLTLTEGTLVLVVTRLEVVTPPERKHFAGSEGEGLRRAQP